MIQRWVRMDFHVPHIVSNTPHIVAQIHKHLIYKKLKQYNLIQEKKILSGVFGEGPVNNNLLPRKILRGAAIFLRKHPGKILWGFETHFVGHFRDEERAFL